MAKLRLIREGGDSNSEDLKVCIWSFVELCEHDADPLALYREEIEANILEETEAYYQKESNLKFTLLPIIDFIEYVNDVSS